MLYGYDRRTEEFMMRDPALGPEPIAMHQSCIDAARTAFGTDEDLLLIKLP